MQLKTPNPIDVSVGEQIRMRRKSMGMSQGALGERLGITFQQIQKYETGKNRVGASRLQAIASVLGVDVSFLFAPGPDGQVEAASRPGDVDNMRAFFSSSEGFALNRAFSGIKNEDVRRKVVALVVSIASIEDEVDRPGVSDEW